MSEQLLKERRKNAVRYMDLSKCRACVDYSVGRFGAVTIVSNDEHPIGVIIAWLPPGRRIDQAHVDHIRCEWRRQQNCRPLSVEESAHAIEVAEGTLHTNSGSTQRIISAYFNVDLDQVTPDARLTDDLGADSLDLVELAMELEELTGVNISDDEILACRTVADVYDIVGRGMCVKQSIHEAV